MTETNSFINVHDLKLEFFFFLHKTFIVNMYSWIIKSTADCLFLCLLYDGSSHHWCFWRFPIILLQLYKLFLQELFLILSENSQLVQAVMP